MDDLISRVAAIEYLMTNMGWYDEDGYAVDDADEKRAIITDLVNGMPAVDAVPVVRCRECRYWFGPDDGRVHSCELDALCRPADWYCAGGKRRENDEADSV